MNTADDPVWVYFDSQHKYILTRMQQSHTVCFRAVHGVCTGSHNRRNMYSLGLPDVRESMSPSLSEPAALAKDLHVAISALGLITADDVHGELGAKCKSSGVLINCGCVAKGTGSEVWISILAMVKSISEVILSSLPPFWKVAKDYMDGKFKKVGLYGYSVPMLLILQRAWLVIQNTAAGGTTSSRRSPSQCRTMALDIVKLYISLLSEFFTLSDKAVATPLTNMSVPPFVPPGSNSITTAYYVSKILSEMNECVNEVMTVELAGDASAELRSLLESARWRFEDALCDTWMRGRYAMVFSHQPRSHTERCFLSYQMPRHYICLKHGSSIQNDLLQLSTSVTSTNSKSSRPLRRTR